MAHATDYASQSDISKLRKAPSSMNPRIKLSKIIDKTSMRDSHAHILTSNFLRENSSWSIDSAYNYCMQYYAEFGITKEIFASALNAYILEK
jgi:hypothetical protein